MDGELITWLFIIGGVILLGMEALIPSGMSFILGFSGLLVGILRFIGFLDDPVTATLVWVGLSAGITLFSLPLLRKYFGGDTVKKLADEDYEAMDKVVTVVEAIDEHSDEGRIRFQGISWQARSLDGDIPAGSEARIKYRDNTTWIVEPVQKIPGNSSDKLPLKN